MPAVSNRPDKENPLLHELLAKADRDGYAVPAFNYNDVWDFTAIVAAAEEERSPVILMSTPKVVNAIGLDICGAWGAAAARKAAVPVVNHLDHSPDIDLCLRAIDAGYPSVMIDASKLPLEENIAAVLQVVQYAHERGAHVEAELGRIKGRDFEGSFEGTDFLVNTAEAVRLVEQTRVDALAIGIGTAHGFYHGAPELDFKRLADMNASVSTPLVLHGGTGIPVADIREAIRHGMNKINVGTIIRHTHLTALKEELCGTDALPHTIDLMLRVRPKVMAEVRAWIGACMSNGKA